VLLSIQGGSDLGLFEINEAARLVQEVAHPEANIIFGAVIDDALGDEARVTVIAAGFDDVKATSPSLEDNQQAKAKATPPVPAAPPASAAQTTAQRPAVQTSQVHSGLSQWSQSHTSPADSGFDVELPAVVEHDLTGSRDDLDVPDFLK
jgi:cell division protein FtsZ